MAVDQEAIQQKAEELDNSRPLYMWRLSDHPEAKAAIDHVFYEINDAGMVSKRYKDKWRGVVRAIVLDLFVANKTDPTMYIAYSRNENDYKVESRYGSYFLSGQIVIQFVDYLKDNDYIEHHLGFNADGRGRLSRMRATDNLINILVEEHEVTVPMIEHNPDEQVIILRDADKKDIEYEDTPEVIQMRENVHLINRNLAKHAILLEVTDDDLTDLQKRLDRKLNFADKRLRRIFNNESWEQGGRFFGGWWQNVPREYRKFIRINDKDVVECDYSGLHINMLYAMDKLPMPKGDVYYLEGYPNDDTFRDFVKRMLLIMVNSDNRDAVRRAIHKAVHYKKSLKLPSEIPSTKGKDLNPILDAFEDKHEPIKKYFCSGVGIDLQNKDSIIAEKVLLKFSEWNLAILPMHDSFIIHHSQEKNLKKAMRKDFKDMFGVTSEVDLKYSSIEERRKDNPESEACDKSLEELFEERKSYETYELLLKEHRRLKKVL